MQEIKKGNNKFYVGEDEQHPQAEITFEKSTEDYLIIDHTFVSDELRGQGIAGKLVEKAVEYAREEDTKIVATCSYAKGKIEKTPEFEDILVN